MTFYDEEPENVFPEGEMFDARKEFPKSMMNPIIERPKFEKIVVAYWVPNESMQEKVGIKHNAVFTYSLATQLRIIEDILEQDLQIMIRPLKAENSLLILIDDRRFTQR
jgi:hypothetical protein